MISAGRKPGIQKGYDFMIYILQIEYGTFTTHQSEESIEDLNEYMVQIDDEEEIARFESKEEAIEELKKYTSKLYFEQTRCKDIYSVDFKQYSILAYDEEEEEYTEVATAPY